jgi:hydrogenase nickel incorporation protein HypA/HybF
VHELSLMQTALELAFAQARQVGASRIHRLRLRIGDLSGVVPDALEMAFAAATPGTAADGAQLVVECVPVVCRCPHCDQVFRPADIVYLCPQCGEITACVEQGREMELASLEVS